MLYIKSTITSLNKFPYSLIQPEIYFTKFSKFDQKWNIPAKVSTTINGSYSPSITNFLNDIYISYTDLSTVSSIIKITNSSQI